MFTSIVVLVIGLVAAVMYQIFETEVNAYLASTIKIKEEESEEILAARALMQSRRLPDGSIAIRESGMECQLHHDYPCYWPSSK